MTSLTRGCGSFSPEPSALRGGSPLLRIKEIRAARIVIPRDGYLVPSDAPGFGIEVTRDEPEKCASVSSDY